MNPTHFNVNYYSKSPVQIKCGFCQVVVSDASATVSCSVLVSNCSCERIRNTQHEQYIKHEESLITVTTF